MATIKFITVGTLKEKYLSDAVAEYEKRLLQGRKHQLKGSKAPTGAVAE